MELALELPKWDPSATHFQEQEDDMLDSAGKLKDLPVNWNPQRVVAALHALPQQVQPDHEFGTAIWQT